MGSKAASAMRRKFCRNWVGQGIRCQVRGDRIIAKASSSEFPSQKVPTAAAPVPRRVAEPPGGGVSGLAVAIEGIERLCLDVDEAGILLQEPLQLRVDPRPRRLVARRGRRRQLVVYDACIRGLRKSRFSLLSGV